MLPTLDDVLQTAVEYCRLIESAKPGSDQWLRELIELLPRLHVAMTAIELLPEGEGDVMSVDLDARFDLFTQLRRLLGDRDAYWLEFDVAQDGQSMSGSLADDLTDIYCELKFGLNRLEANLDPNLTLLGWRHGFRHHWGQHLVDAERHLYTLAARDQLAVGSRY